MVKSSNNNILITGYPGVGKTTLVVKLAALLHDMRPAGFFTSEIRENRIRKGFELVSLAGKRGVLSHVGIRSPYRVGKYGVDVGGFNRFLSTLDLLNSRSSLIVIDEIGRMECFSSEFENLLENILDSEKRLIATVARRGGGIIERIKRRRDIILFEVTTANRDSLLKKIVALVQKQ
ncbi:MAG: NTPase [Candidatus Zixiibacteriota bacterium]|nr:MAG: NTPase [candidate division Zixibacteria bacterium]